MGTPVKNGWLKGSSKRELWGHRTVQLAASRQPFVLRTGDCRMMMMMMMMMTTTMMILSDRLRSFSSNPRGLPARRRQTTIFRNYGTPSRLHIATIAWCIWVYKVNERRTMIVEIHVHVLSAENDCVILHGRGRSINASCLKYAPAYISVVGWWEVTFYLSMTNLPASYYPIYVHLPTVSVFYCLLLKVILNC